jgi:hypothetical protein
VNLEYKDDALITSVGGISQNLATDITALLEKDFGFRDIKTNILSDVKDIQPHLDFEPKFRQPRDMLSLYKNKHVFIVQYFRTIDNRFELQLRDLRQNVNNLAELVKNGSITGDAANIVNMLEEQSQGFSRYIEPDFENKAASRWQSTRFNPSGVFLQLLGQIHSAKMGEAKHISVVMPNSLFELSHSFLKQWNIKHRYEMPLFDIFLETIKQRGADSIILLHPHAPKEGLEITERLRMNYVGIFPQTLTINSNRWIYSVDKFFGNLNLNPSTYDPIGSYFRNRQTEIVRLYNMANQKFLASRTDDEKKRDMDISSLLIYVASPDGGAHTNSSIAADRYKLHAVRSSKDREGEADSKIVKSDSLEGHLLRLKEFIPSAEIEVNILDDFQNSGKTANDEAELRKNQIRDFNKKFGTDYSVKVNIIATHIRFPYMKEFLCGNLDRVTSYDTVPYLPTLEQQVQMYGFNGKFNIVKNTTNQIALGIALDYFAQQKHTDESRHLLSGVRRAQTDKELAFIKGFGAKQLYFPHEELTK